MKKILAISLLLLLAGCGDKLNITTKPVDINVAQPPNPEPVKMLPVQWIVVTKENLDDFLSKMANGVKDGVVFIGITTKDYENLRLNLEDLRRFIEQQNAIIVYYKNITSPTK